VEAQDRSWGLVYIYFSFAARVGWTRALARGTGAPTRDNGREMRGAGAKAAAVEIRRAKRCMESVQE